MDSQLGLASKEDLWRLQNEMKNVYATQAEHSDRLARLERRQDDDTRMKSVWGTQSPFPGILGGTPQQGAVSLYGELSTILTLIPEQGYNPAAEAFKNFDQDQSTNLLGSLHLDSEDEPRRGASRANSVRFDEKALHGHFSRSSTEFLPLRTGSAFGSHPLTERSSSHKSDGRQSSAGQSVHSVPSARANSFGFESRPLSATVAPFVPLGPPPGLFILGPVPSIVRCWLTTNFSNDSLLYAAVCTASYKSVLSRSLVSELGFEDQMTKDRDGQQVLKIPVYLPEATIQQSSSRSNSPAPQLPTITVDFVIQDSRYDSNALQIFLGCDVLRARSADIHFSLDRLTIFDDDRNKISMPLVRPENARLFQTLATRNYEADEQHPSTHDIISPKNLEQNALNQNHTAAGDNVKQPQAEAEQHGHFAESSTGTPLTSSSSVIVEGRKPSIDQETSEDQLSLSQTSESLTNGTTPDTPTRADNGSIWGSWRRDSIQNGRSEAASSISTSGYQRAGRGRGMKVLKPARLNTSRSTSAAQPPVGFDALPSRSSDASKRNGQGSDVEGQENRASAVERKSFSSEVKTPVQSATPKSRSANPVGGASAFGWLNANQQKPSNQTAE
ncbi:hypothetical protein G7Y79_00035g070660 [Physcia stellaris]|nr:hypothetical protein G7Y79_00035g070660 [Physcia stellaris]